MSSFIFRVEQLKILKKCQAIVCWAITIRAVDTCPFNAFLSRDLVWAILRYSFNKTKILISWYTVFLCILRDLYQLENIEFKLTNLVFSFRCITLEKFVEVVKPFFYFRLSASQRNQIVEDDQSKQTLSLCQILHLKNK